MVIWITLIILVIITIWRLTRSARYPLTDSTDQLPGHDKIARDELAIKCPLVYNGNELEFPMKCCIPCLRSISSIITAC